ncbi:ABC transporter permease [Litoreibacter albidus]|uniref:Spermidine/putrescine transport system permease protein n=1 Tax=Litoreibacter albidus TaxID=670155 RepID=A0A1H2Y317_9RHOB|nr:ABC transporter permease [Litoreibacter albidus]SDW99526.1 spermidine/putrescine transport system permease protein [Litoreibacter albidus]
MKKPMIFSQFFKNNGAVMGSALIGLVAFWLIFLIILPQLSMLDYSFRYNLPPAEVGGPKDVYTLSNYEHLIYGSDSSHQTYNTVDLKVFMRTILAAMLVTIFNIFLCYPLAYFLGQSKGSGFVRLLVVLLIIPYWINEILRAFALRIIFGDSGLLNEALMFLHLTSAPIDFIRQDIALYAGLGYAYILLMLFPMYNVIESLDRNQIEAARDMGASWLHIHRRIVIPYAKPGIVSGATMVFMLSAGALAAPQILGGPSSLWFTQLVYQWFNDSLNWQQGAAYAIVLLVSTIVIVLTVMRVFKVNMGDIGK